MRRNVIKGAGEAAAETLALDLHPSPWVYTPHCFGADPPPPGTRPLATST